MNDKPTKECVEIMARDLDKLPMQIIESGRRNGKTTAAMLAAPRGAIYVWCNGHLGYPRDLAKKLGRDDLQIVGPDYVIQYRFAGLKVPVATDHALRIHPDVRFHISNHNLKVKP